MSWFDNILRRDADSTKVKTSEDSGSRSGSPSLSSSYSIPLPIDSWAMLILNRLRDEDAGLNDVVRCLTEKKCVLLLPVSRPKHPSASVDREFIEDHVLWVSTSDDNLQTISLSGLRGAIQKDDFIALGLLPEGQERSTTAVGFDQKPLFDSLSLDPSSITPDHPTCKILASGLNVPFRNSTIDAMTIQRPISRKELQDWSNERKKTASSSIYPPSRFEDSLSEFERSLRRNLPRKAEDTQRKCIQFLEKERERMDKERGWQIDTEAELDVLETCMCARLYDCLFKKANEREFSRDEALQSRIAELNLLDLNLEHLGVFLDDEREAENTSLAIRDAGKQLQVLDNIRGAKEKLDVLVKTLEVIVEKTGSFAKQSTGSDPKLEQETKESSSTINNDANLPETLNGESLEQDISPVNVSEPDQPLSGTSKEIAPAAQMADQEPPRRVDGDILLPLLIYSIVKSNPTNFITNLTFILLYRHPKRVSGLQSYCITSMLAAVEFLEKTNLGELNLPPDRVFSHISSLNESVNRSISEDVRFGGSLKLVSDVVDGIGRLLQKKDTDTLQPTTTWWSNSSAHIAEMKSQMMSRVSKSGSQLRELEDMKDKALSKTGIRADPLQSLWQVSSNIIHSVQRAPQSDDGPLQKFLDIKSVEEITIGEVAELLADYKRLAAIVKQYQAQ